MNVPQSRSRGAVTLTQGWLGWDGSRGRRDGRWREREPRNWWSDDEDDDEYGDRSYGTFRTLCVRLCDGFYWPISYATTPEYFERDRRKCESSCGSPARLFTYRNPGGELEEMEDLSGRPYSRLKTAFLYRTQFVESCKCRSDPWEQASLDRHRMYALDAARRKGDRVAGQELEELRARMDAARRTAQVTPSPSSVYSDVELAEDGRTAAPQPAQSDRMSLGARPSGRSRSSAPPIMIWRHTNEQAP